MVSNGHYKVYFLLLISYFENYSFDVVMLQCATSAKKNYWKIDLSFVPVSCPFWYYFCKRNNTRWHCRVVTLSIQMYKWVPSREGGVVVLLVTDRSWVEPHSDGRVKPEVSLVHTVPPSFFLIFRATS